MAFLTAYGDVWVKAGHNSSDANVAVAVNGCVKEDEKVLNKRTH